ncbi:MAG: NADH-quinone oxidoreductase subunit NuoG [Actinomycetota bacterium]|nr:NADH-quinone oxidoreductase subunit NuoG [Actinomycetota bacterium]
MADEISFILDGKEITAEPGELIIAAAERNGVYIPRFCYHPHMPSVGMCRMCLVEVKGPRGFALSPSCYLTVAPGMEVVTDSPKVKKAQNGVLEFLLVNHPLDCPVCDKGGECPLQDQVLSYGPGESRFVEEKRHFEKPIALSSLVYLDRERCIQCDRCTRFASEVALDPLIEFVGRGDRTEVATFPDHPFASYFSGNTVQICPVGALTAKPYRFKARPWDLDQSESTCTTCALGCRISVQSSRGEITRYLGLDSEAVNHSWLCDRGRFGYESTNSEHRIVKPLLKGRDGVLEVTWKEALTKVAHLINEAKRNSTPIAFIGGANFSNEGIYSFVKLAREAIGTGLIDARVEGDITPSLIFGTNSATINQVVSSPLIVVSSQDLKEVLPVLYLRLVEAKRAGARIVEISETPTELSKISERISLSQLEFASFLEGSDVDASIGERLSKALDDLNLLEAPTFILGRASYGGSSNLVERIASRLIGRIPKLSFLHVMGAANIRGAYEMGAVPGFTYGRVGSNLSTYGAASVVEILELAASKETLLFLLDEDMNSSTVPSELVERVRETSTVISIASLKSKITELADVVLPVVAAGEYDGTTTNIEGRVSRISARVTPKGLSQEPSVIANEIAREIGIDLGKYEPSEIFQEIVANCSTFGNLTYNMLSSDRFADGVVVPLTATEVSLKGRRRLDPVATPGLLAIENVGPAITYIAEEELRPLENEVSRRSSAINFDASFDLEVAASRSGFSRILVEKPLYAPNAQLAASESMQSLASQAMAFLAPNVIEADYSGETVTLKRSDGKEVVVAYQVDKSLPSDTIRLRIGTNYDLLNIVDPSANATFVTLGDK